MLSEYEIDQKIVCGILNNAIKDNRYSHAYLFELNDYEKSDKFILNFVKGIICNKNNSFNLEDASKIDSNNHPDFIVIEPFGNIIKKEQVQAIQKELSKTSSNDNIRVYLIKNAEKMNSSAYNSILKFLEEPNKNIIAILTTSNIYQLSKTIISRCQIINFERCHNQKKHIDKYIDEKTEINLVLDFVKLLETKKVKTIIYTKKQWLNNFKGKDNIFNILNIMVLIYKDSLNYKLNKKTVYFDENDILKTLSQQKDQVLCKKINILLEYIKYINYNLNENLFIDKLIIDFERCE